MEGVGLGGHVAQGLGGALGGGQVLDGVGHLAGVTGQPLQDGGLGAGGQALADGALGGDGAGQVAHVAVDGGQQLLAGHLQHGQGLDVDDLGVVLHLHLVPAEHLGAGHDAELLHQLDVLGRDEGGQGRGGVLLVGQAAALGLDLPLGRVAVAVEDDAPVVADGPLDQGDHRVGEVLGGFQLVGVALQLLGHGGVQDGVGVAEVLVAAGHPELELVAGEGEGGGAVAVGGVLAELGQHVHAQVHLHLDGAGVGRVGGDGVDDGLQLLAHEDGDDGRGRLVGAQAVVVAGGGHRGAQQVGVFIHRLDDGRQEHQELQVLHGGVAGVQQVFVAGAHGPVVVLAAAVDPLEGLLVQQADQAVLGGDLLHHLHGQQVVVDGHVGGVEDGGQLMLAGGHLVVLGLGGHAQLPQHVVQLLHESGHPGPDGAKVVLLQLLALGGRRAEQGAAGQDQVLPGLVVLLAHQEILLLGAHGGGHMGGLLAKQPEDALRLDGQGLHRAQQGGLHVQGLAGVADEGGGDAQHVVLDKGVAGGVPGGVAAGLAGGPQAAGGEGGGVGLAADQLLAAELHDGGAVAHRADKAVVLFAGDAGQRLEPVGVVGRAQLHGPALHDAGHDVGHFDVQGGALVQGVLQALIGGAGQALLHHVLVEDLAAVDFHYVGCHKSYSLLTISPGCAGACRPTGGYGCRTHTKGAASRR